MRSVVVGEMAKRFWLYPYAYLITMVLGIRLLDCGPLQSPHFWDTHRCLHAMSGLHDSVRPLDEQADLEDAQIRRRTIVLALTAGFTHQRHRPHMVLIPYI